MITPNTVEIIQCRKPSLFDPGENFVEASKLHRHLVEAEVPGIRELAQSPLLLDATARATKPYPQQPPIHLPPPTIFEERMSYRELLQNRRSPRHLAPAAPLSLEQLSWLCWATDGNNGEISPGRYGRTAPSGGALYPRDLFVATSGGQLDPGLYHYNPYNHQLEYVNKTTSEELAKGTAQPDLGAGGSGLVLSASFWRNRMKYEQRGVRFSLIELGHVAQNALLAATMLGLAALPLGGFFDEEINAMIGLDGLHETVAYVIMLGKPVTENHGRE